MTLTLTVLLYEYCRLPSQSQLLREWRIANLKLYRDRIREKFAFIRRGYFHDEIVIILICVHRERWKIFKPFKTSFPQNKVYIRPFLKFHVRGASTNGETRYRYETESSPVTVFEKTAIAKFIDFDIIHTIYERIKVQNSIRIMKRKFGKVMVPV